MSEVDSGVRFAHRLAARDHDSERTFGNLAAVPDPSSVPDATIADMVDLAGRRSFVTGQTLVVDGGSTA